MAFCPVRERKLIRVRDALKLHGLINHCSGLVYQLIAFASLLSFASCPVSLCPRVIRRAEKRREEKTERRNLSPHGRRKKSRAIIWGKKKAFLVWKENVYIHICDKTRKNMYLKEDLPCRRIPLLLRDRGGSGFYAFCRIPERPICPRSR